ncbi:hypothetical protein BASA81_006564 [Batrachochytrium salamandrivorans]|nr:hypothetical protein BASA81_006564 [Batrachochytrium salamandrivorans]
MATSSSGADAWQFATDKATGNVYFYNRATRETRWTLPADEEQTTCLIASLSEAHALLKRERASLSHIKEAVDRSTGKTYYYDSKTKETFWDDPRRPAAPLAAVPQTQALTETPRVKHHPVSLFSVSPTRQPRFEEDEAEQPASFFSAREQHKPLFDEDLEPSPRTPTRAVSFGSHHSSPFVQVFKEEEEVVTAKPPPTAVQFNKDHLRLIKKRMGQLQPQAPTVAEPPIPKREVAVKPVEEEEEFVPKRAVRMVVKANKEEEEEAPPVIVRTKTAVVEQVLRPKPVRQQTACLRRSGCTCNACSPNVLDGDGAVALSQDELVPCRSCNRKFSSRSLVVHERVCAKVFKPALSSSSPPAAAVATAAVVGEKKKSNAKWRKQSEELRAAMQRGRGEEPSTKPVLVSATTMTTADAENEQDDGLVMCPHCERRFNDKAAERHIPKCTSIMSKPKMLKRGEGKSVAKPLAPAPPPSAAKRTSIADRQAASANLTCPTCRLAFASQRILERHLDACGPPATPKPKPWQQRKPLPPAPPSAGSQSSWDDYS